MRNVLFFLLISIIYCQNANAQTVLETYAKAEVFSAQGQYEEATKLYQRILFFTEESDTLKPYFYASAAKAFLELRQYEKAADYFANASLLIVNDSVRIHYKLQRIKVLLLQYNYQQAKNELNKIDTAKYPSTKPGIYLYTGIYYFGLKEYDSAHKYFAKIIGQDVNKQQQLEKLFRKNEAIKYTDPKVASIMSVILPGSGQIYSGSFDRGMNSFLLTSVFAVLGYNTYAAYGFLEAMVSVSPWFLRYYTSGIKNAAELAKTRQAQKRQKVFNQMLVLLSANTN